MNGPAALADHLDTRPKAIILAWWEAVESGGDVPEAERLSYVEFADHIPQLLDRLAERLRGRPADVVAEGQKHGQMRWRQGYDISEVVGEMGHLRSILTHATFEYAQAQGFDLEAVHSICDVINEVLNQASAEAIRQFQEESGQETHSAREEAELRRSAVEEAWIAAEVERSKLRSLLGSLPVGVWVADPTGMIVAANREAVRLQGFPEDQTIGRVNTFKLSSAYRIYHLDGTPYGEGEAPLARALGGEVVSQEEFRWDVGDTSMTVVANAAPLLEPSGKIVGAMVVVQDITGRKRLQADLAASEVRFRGIAEQLPVMIWRLGGDGLYDYFNQTWYDFRGRVRGVDSDAGFGWTEAVHPEDRQRCLNVYCDAFEKREPFEHTYRMRRHDGQYRWVADRGTPYHDDRGHFLGFLGSCLDVTERIDLERSLEQQKEMAEESSRHKTRLLSALSHDARTPLNAVVLSVQLLEMHRQADDDPEVQQCLRTIRHSVGNVLDLLGDLLNLSKIDAGAMPAEPTRFPLSPVLEECLASIEGQARAKGLDVRLDPDGLEGAELETDRAKLKQILCNLLSNALRYTHQGHIRLFGERTADQVRLSVEDTGVGIHPADHQRIFDEFATLEQPHRQVGEGTGLGLAICRRLANLLSGEITLKSEPGRGSLFTLALPSVLLTSAPPEAAPEEATAPAPQGGAILVVEDHLTSRQTLAKILRRMGYRTAEAGNGRDALALAREERPMAVLMDVNMPVMDGIDATLALRADHRFHGLHIFALTGDVSVVNQRRIDEAGVDGYLEKPVTREALKRALDSIRARPSVVDGSGPLDGVSRPGS